MGCTTQCHDKPGIRCSWDPHSSDGLYIGTLMEHHRCFNVFGKATGAEQVSDTVHFNHRYITTPAFNSTDAILKAANKLTAAIKGTPTSGQTTDAALKQVAELFTKIAEEKRHAEAEASTHRPPRAEAPIQRVPRNEQIVTLQIVTLQQIVETAESPIPIMQPNVQYCAPPKRHHQCFWRCRQAPHLPQCNQMRSPVHRIPPTNMSPTS